MFGTAMCCRQVCQYIYEQFITWAAFQTAGHMYIKIVIITCQEKFPTARSLQKIQVSFTAFSNPTKSLYLPNTDHHSCKPCWNPELTRVDCIPALSICSSLWRLWVTNIPLPIQSCPRTAWDVLKSTGSPKDIRRLYLHHVPAGKMNLTTRDLLQRRSPGSVRL